MKVLLEQDAFPLVCPVAFKNDGRNTPRAVKMPLGWALSGPLTISEKAQCYSVGNMNKNEKLTAAVRYL